MVPIKRTQRNYRGVSVGGFIVGWTVMGLLAVDALWRYYLRDAVRLWREKGTKP